MIKSQKFIIFVGCEKFTKICPCGAMDSRLRGNDEGEGVGVGDGCVVLFSLF